MGKTFGEMLREKRNLYGVTQAKLAMNAGITKIYLSMIETNKKIPSDVKKERLLSELERLNPDEPLFLLFDYVRIRYPTKDFRHVIHDILKLNIDYMAHEDYGMFRYEERYFIGDVLILISDDIEKGTLLELRGKGCRQFENYMTAQNRTWYDFFLLSMEEGAVIKRLDLAINDRTGILDIPMLIEKCKNDECVGIFRGFSSYSSGDMVKHHEDYKKEMGNTLYIGSVKSDVYFCVYEKDYEQLKKEGIPIEESDVKNRFEIRLKNERAYYAIRDLLTYNNLGQTSFAIIKRYIRFVDREEGVKRSEWKININWKEFIFQAEYALKLTTKPMPYTVVKTLRWLKKQVFPSLKMVDEIFKNTEVDYDLIKELKKTKLEEKHRKIISQQITEVEKIILDYKNN